jgi:hypothetical protein
MEKIMTLRMKEKSLTTMKLILLMMDLITMMSKIKMINMMMEK